MQSRGTPGLVLPGGGARAAYQVGVLKAIAAVTGSQQLPFRAVSGISAGAINAAALVQRGDDFFGAVEALERVWTGMRAGDVYEMDVARLQGLFSRKRRPIALFDNAPLGRLLRRELDPDALASAIATDVVRGLAVTASNYSTGDAITFVQANTAQHAWGHHRRSVQTRITTEHLLASSALPLLFPAQRVGADYFVDGSLRMTAPLSPVINLGADRILVIGVRHESLRPGSHPVFVPGLGEIGGYLLESIFAENLDADLERAQQINTMLGMIPSWRRNHTGRKRIEVMVVRPSSDVRVMAARFSSRLPRSIRLFLRTLGGWGRDWRLPSYLLFEGVFASALIELGYRDGLRHRPALEAFFAGS